ncbi:MAG: 4Fe-4S cluster-binding domain-containing protein, partial [Clostridia bacterium]|nr:4Fe-4S cluster-binding domain-containing protein [Clostridia bacterium]
MLQVNKPIDIIIKAAGKQKIKTNNLRPLTYLQVCEVEDGFLLYNLMTREMLLLDDVEFKAYDSCDLTNETVSYLVENWFIVPEEFNDYLLFKQTDALYRMIADSNKKPNMHTFVIYPTTDCNARCFYCFELSYKRINMTEQTAHDVAKYIINKCGGDKVQILWFGGEPLYNSKVIDIISTDLKNNQIKFRSKMTSNAYLFDEVLID